MKINIKPCKICGNDNPFIVKSNANKKIILLCYGKKEDGLICDFYTYADEHFLSNAIEIWNDNNE